MTKTFFIETWGCQMNDLDSQRLSGSLKLRGYRRVETEGEADLILLNTCSIRDKSEQKVFSHLGRLRAGLAESLDTSEIHLDILTNLKRISSHVSALAISILEEV